MLHQNNHTFITGLNTGKLISYAQKCTLFEPTAYTAAFKLLLCYFMVQNGMQVWYSISLASKSDGRELLSKKTKV